MKRHSYLTQNNEGENPTNMSKGEKGTLVRDLEQSGDLKSSIGSTAKQL